MPINLKEACSRRRKLTLIVKHSGAERGMPDYIIRAGVLAASYPSVDGSPLTL